MTTELTDTTMATTTAKKSVFETLNKINCNEHIEMKNGLSYLSWAWAWQIVKTNYPNAFYTIYESKDNIPYFTDGKTCWVKTGVCIEGLEHIEYLPIMDFRNNSIPADKVTSMDMNKAIQRSLTKACARHGLGLYIYAGEDLPQDEKEIKESVKKEAKPMKQEAIPEERKFPVYNPCDIETYYKFVESEAKGIKCKSGKTSRERWIEMTNADEKAVSVFDEDVKNYNTANI